MEPNPRADSDLAVSWPRLRAGYVIFCACSDWHQRGRVLRLAAATVWRRFVASFTPPG